MALQDAYPFLPGHLVEFKDGGLQIKAEPNAPTTESVLIMGCSPDGPTGTPVAVDPTTVTLYGKGTNKLGIPIGNTILQGFEEAWKAGCRDIRCLRISGKPARIELGLDVSVTNQTPKQITELLSSAAPGNLEQSFQVNYIPIVPDSIVVKAKDPMTLNEVTLPAEAIKVGEGGTNVETGTVILNSGVTGVGYLITIDYDYDDGSGTPVHKSETATETVDGGSVPWITQGNGNLTKSLAHTPVAGSLSVTVDGEDLDRAKYSVAGNVISVAEDAVPLGASVQIKYSYYLESTVNVTLPLESAWSGSLYSDTLISVENIENEIGEVLGRKLVLQLPVAKVGKGAEPMVYASTKYPTLGLLAQAINADLRSGVGLLKCACPKSVENVPTTKLTLKPAGPMQGGEDGMGLTKQEIYDILDGDGTPANPGTYKLLENYKVDYIVPMGVYHDDKLADPTKSFSYQLALACAVISHRSYATHGVIACQGPEETGLLAVHNYVSGLVSESPNYFPMVDAEGNIIRDEDDNEFDLGRYISVVAGPDIIFKSTYTGTYTTVSAANYAGMVSNMPVESSPLNKEVPGIQGLRYGFGNPQLNKLVGNRFVCYTFKDNNAKIVVSDAMTAAKAGSDYSQLNAYRAVKKAVEAVRAAADPFLGEPSTVANKNAMSAAITKKLEALQNAHAINGFGFEIIQSVADMVLGNAAIELTIVPPLTLRRITTTVSLKPQ